MSELRSVTAPDRRRVDPDLLLLRVRKLLWLVRHRKRWPFLRKGIAPSIEHSGLFAGRRFATVVDVGANLGQFALWAAETLRAERIICVEPLPDSGARLQELASWLKPCRVEVLNVALGAVNDRRALHMTAASDSSSLLAPVAGAATGPFREVGTETVEVAVADDVLPGSYARPLLVKIDVQGTELDVLAGMPALLRVADAVLVEVSFARLYDGQADPSAVVEHLLTTAGFTLAGIARVPGSSGGWELDQADLLFERK